MKSLLDKAMSERFCRIKKGLEALDLISDVVTDTIDGDKEIVESYKLSDSNQDELKFSDKSLSFANESIDELREFLENALLEF